MDLLTVLDFAIQESNSFFGIFYHLPRHIWSFRLAYNAIRNGLGANDVFLQGFRILGPGTDILFYFFVNNMDLALP